MSLRALLCVAAVSIGTAGCEGGGVVDDQWPVGDGPLPDSAATADVTIAARIATPVGTAGRVTDDAENEDLPATSSPLPSIGLAGVVALAAGIGLRRISRPDPLAKR